MIIIGYPGIGKSTLAKKNDKIIDLDSSCFRKYDKEDLYKRGKGVKPNNWYIYYCQVAQELSKQGYLVFVSSHKEVRDFLNVHNNEKVCIIFPNESLATDWKHKLWRRYDEIPTDKNFRAMEHVNKYFERDVREISEECQYNMDYYDDMYVIDDIKNYDLQKIVNKLNQER